MISHPACYSAQSTAIFAKRMQATVYLATHINRRPPLWPPVRRDPFSHLVRLSLSLSLKYQIHAHAGLTRKRIQLELDKQRYTARGKTHLRTGCVCERISAGRKVFPKASRESRLVNPNKRHSFPWRGESRASCKRERDREGKQSSNYY